jgi:hypothetical protein
MTRVEKPQEIAMSDIHDNPLLNYPHVIVTLMRQRAIKIVKQELAAQGIKLWDVTSAQIQLLAQAYVQSHREEMIRVACDTVRIAHGLRELAEQEARRRAKARARDCDVARSGRAIGSKLR